MHNAADRSNYGSQPARRRRNSESALSRRPGRIGRTGDCEASRCFRLGPKRQQLLYRLICRLSSVEGAVVSWAQTVSSLRQELSVGTIPEQKLQTGMQT